jgi:hypothetical protein
MAAFEAESADKRKKALGVRGRRNSLITLDSAKEIQGFSKRQIWLNFAARALDLAGFGFGVDKLIF